jgi:hypothetical protein
MSMPSVDGQIWGPLVSFLLGIIAVLLGVLVRQNSKLECKVEDRVEKEACDKQHEATSKDREGIWGALNAHSHTGLPPDARVVR